MKVGFGRVPVLSGVAENSTAAACHYVRDCEKLGSGRLYAHAGYGLQRRPARNPGALSSRGQGDRPCRS